VGRRKLPPIRFPRSVRLVPGAETLVIESDEWRSSCAVDVAKVAQLANATLRIYALTEAGAALLGSKVLTGTAAERLVIKGKGSGRFQATIQSDIAQGAVPEFPVEMLAFGSTGA
jgi:hypothetical protein